ncbi:(d)CMP kinase [Natronospira bacteriovora]|uniref:Cytidylate kinase n=1 Tax=Natronospira bacteriovora TaxID=3069753 RepID=A0ABU0W590_9GAMM|nr:(d)CMP kinase [Natronospira sp. AB-CW4]MDQ2069183.1 (d)CMP kinase [Natronospira sp. AB-CW4]
MATQTSIPVITIDGPSGVGKGTTARLVAERLGWHLLDSGALYRVLAHAAMENDVPLDAEAHLGQMAERLGVRFEGEKVLLEGRDVSGQIRTEACGGVASQVAALPAVRAGLLRLQKDFRQPPGLVADGRDMGTEVFPDAQVKVFLTATPAERARRRHKQLKEKGIDANVSELESAIAERDRRDAERKASPLKPADDAVEIDTTDKSIPVVLDLVLSLVEEKTGHRPA